MPSPYLGAEVPADAQEVGEGYGLEAGERGAVGGGRELLPTLERHVCFV